MPTPDELKKLNEARRAEIYEKFKQDAAASQQRQQELPASKDEGWLTGLRRTIEDTIGLKDGKLGGKFGEFAEKISEGKSPLVNNDGVGLSGLERLKTVDAIVEGQVVAAPVIKPPGP